MNNMSRSFKNEDGSEETIVINSTDNLTIDLSKKYRLANHTETVGSKLTKKFKGSILGTDIGVKSGGFTNIAILSTIIAISVLAFMYFMWRF